MEPFYTVGGNVNWCSQLWETVWRFLKKLKIELSYDLAILLLDMHPKKTKTLIRKDRRTPVFIAALFTIVKAWKKPKCPSIDEWIKEDVTYTCIYIFMYTHLYI